MENKLSPLRVGAISEMKVCVDLMGKGFDVFRAMAQNASCDLVAIKDNQVIRIEVRTTSESDNGSIRQAIKPTDAGRSDCYAWVTDNAIEYSDDITTISLSKYLQEVKKEISIDNDEEIEEIRLLKLNKNALRVYSFLAFIEENDFFVEQQRKFYMENNPKKYPQGKYISEDILCNEMALFTKRQLAIGIRDLIGLEILFYSNRCEYKKKPHEKPILVYETCLNRKTDNVIYLQEMKQHADLYQWTYQRNVEPYHTQIKFIKE